MTEAHGMARSFGTIKAIVRIVGMPSISRYYRSCSMTRNATANR